MCESALPCSSTPAALSTSVSSCLLSALEPSQPLLFLVRLLFFLVLLVFFLVLILRPLASLRLRFSRLRSLVFSPPSGAESLGLAVTVWSSVCSTSVSVSAASVFSVFSAVYLFVLSQFVDPSLCSPPCLCRWKAPPTGVESLCLSVSAWGLVITLSVCSVRLLSVLPCLCRCRSLGAESSGFCGSVFTTSVFSAFLLHAWAYPVGSSPCSTSCERRCGSTPSGVGFLGLSISVGGSVPLASVSLVLLLQCRSLPLVGAAS